MTPYTNTSDADLCASLNDLADAAMRLDSSELLKPDVASLLLEAANRLSRRDFGWAIRQLEGGAKVARQGWNGKKMWISLSHGWQALPAHEFWGDNNRGFARANGGYADVLPYLTMKTADNKILMGWLATQTDMLAQDWVVVS